ncbi:MAG: LysR substrate-binding domain-containing protein [Myxococcota bacterium]|nr:LysR substrate-binding domain-containing protein [Myxococcota bacterium]
MQFTQLRAFHAVATSGSFTAAAKRLHISQPAITQHIKELEAAYETELFIRTRQGAQITAVGFELLEVTSAMIELEKSAQSILEEAGRELIGTLRIAADGPFHSIDILKRFRAEHPKVQIELEVGNSSTIESRLRSHQADVGVLADARAIDGIERLQLGIEEIGLFVGHDHPWAKRDSIAMAELEGVEMIRREKGSRTRDAFERACRSAGVSPTYRMELGSREAVREAVAAGLGVGVVNFAEVGSDPRVSTISVSDAEIRSAEYLIALSSRRSSRLVSAFFASV